LIACADTISTEYRSERCCVVVDSGYSFTHIVPYCEGVAVRNAIMRIDIGGKVLTNLLKEWLSYRQLNVLEETYVINECKEDACFVAENFSRAIALARFGLISFLSVLISGMYYHFSSGMSYHLISVVSYHLISSLSASYLITLSVPHQ
uniref:Actin-like protein (inferred by orthology to a C. elegans protein) n=1 Tax=Anisakis simplex TaxID=6269 RepID=A0A0M3KK77_ANISI